MWNFHRLVFDCVLEKVRSLGMAWQEILRRDRDESALESEFRAF